MAATSSWAIRATCADGGFAARADRRAHRVGRNISAGFHAANRNPWLVKPEARQAGVASTDPPAVADEQTGEVSGRRPRAWVREMGKKVPGFARPAGTCLTDKELDF